MSLKKAAETVKAAASTIAVRAIRSENPQADRVF